MTDPRGPRCPHCLDAQRRTEREWEEGRWRNAAEARDIIAKRKGGAR